MPLLLDVRKLTLITELIQDGAEEVAGSLGALAGVDAAVEIKSISFVHLIDQLDRDVESGKPGRADGDASGPDEADDVQAFEDAFDDA